MSAREPLPVVVEHLRRANRVIVLSGAGMSTAAGIPDFRSPGGLYGTSKTLLERFTYLEQAIKSAKWQRSELKFDVRSALTLSFLRVNPLQYHEMRRGMIIGLGEGQWKLTIAYVFPEILNRNKKLHLLASQNIDGLDHKVVSDPRKLYNPHGLMSVLVSEPMDEPLAIGPTDPIYQRYVELVKSNIKDIYADRPARQGKSSHLWPGPSESTPITLEMFGDFLPEKFKQACAQEGNGTYSVKPGSVLFDRTLWRTNAAGEPCDAFQEVRNCDLVLVMGTSLSGLSIDNVAHMAGPLGVPRIVFDMTEDPVASLSREGCWTPERDCHLQGPLDVSVLGILRDMQWVDQLFDYLPHLCLGSLNVLRLFVADNLIGDVAMEYLAKVDSATEQEQAREQHFYEDD
mmetsp:Transcript_82106/g.235888  ORF Transcript_82106/g.235888 Transcript_82106/m.235888 type:complete len:401 (-) Transcript_82106:213-1415(-)